MGTPLRGIESARPREGRNKMSTVYKDLPTAWNRLAPVKLAGPRRCRMEALMYAGSPDAC